VVLVKFVVMRIERSGMGWSSLPEWAQVVVLVFGIGGALFLASCYLNWKYEDEAPDYEEF
jgi:hypothetical protein